MPGDSKVCDSSFTAQRAAAQIMKTITTLVFVSLFIASSVFAADDGWQSLFDGKSLDGWKASETPGTFSVKDGLLVGIVSKIDIVRRIAE